MFEKKKSLYEHISNVVNEDSDLVPEPQEEAKPEINGELIDELYGIIDNESIDKEQFGTGLQVELEHYDSVNKEMSILAGIVVDHLKEIPTYYTYLAEMEAKAKEDMEQTEETPVEDEVPVEDPQPEPITADEGKIPANPANYTEKDIKTLFENLPTGKDNVVPKGDYNQVDAEGKPMGKLNLPKALRGKIIKNEDGKKTIQVFKEDPKAPGTDKYIVV